VDEIGSNWEGDVHKAEELIRGCKDAGASAVKFQMWRQEDLYPKDISFKKFELSFEDAFDIKNYAQSIGMPFFCSCFYPEAVEFCDHIIDVPWFKVAYRTARFDDIHSKETIQAIAKTGKPVMLSKPHGGRYERVFKMLEPCHIFTMYVVPSYPARDNQIAWKNMELFDGMSDHTLGVESVVRFARLKNEQCIIEKHIMLKDSKSPDTVCSITIQDLQYLMTILTSSSDIPG